MNRPTGRRAGLRLAVASAAAGARIVLPIRHPAAPASAYVAELTYQETTIVSPDPVPGCYRVRVSAVTRLAWLVLVDPPADAPDAGGR